MHNASKKRQVTLPETLYENALEAARIKPTAELVDFLRKRHVEQITPRLVGECLRKYGALEEAELERMEPVESEYSDFYLQELELRGTLPESLLAKILEEEHMKRLARPYVISAFTEFAALYMGGEFRRKGDVL